MPDKHLIKKVLNIIKLKNDNKINSPYNPSFGCVSAVVLYTYKNEQKQQKRKLFAVYSTVFLPQCLCAYYLFGSCLTIFSSVFLTRYVSNISLIAIFYMWGGFCLRERGVCLALKLKKEGKKGGGESQQNKQYTPKRT